MTISSRIQLDIIPFYLQLIYVLVFNAIIAFLVSLSPLGNYWNSFLISQCIGLSILGSCHVYKYFFTVKLSNVWVPAALGIFIGLLFAVTIDSIMTGIVLGEVEKRVARHYDNLLGNMVIALFFCLIIMYFFISRSRIIEANNALQEEIIKNIDNEKRMVETQLRLLQAQIEPHFLFNTLSNIASLIDSNPESGKIMLNHLNNYLRSTLKRSRSSHSTLGHEINIIRNYLEIFKIRMGDRLQYKINLPGKLSQVIFSPLLLQPLVENSIKHGLEPKKDGGEIVIEASNNTNGLLRIEITDSGIGFQNEPRRGIGLDNVRERLKSIYDGKASLSVKENDKGGVTAVVKVPYESF